MKKLYLVRHAKTIDFGYEDDFNRYLTPFGRESASRLGLFLKEKLDELPQIMTSSALRTVQTSEIVAQEIGFDIEKIQKFDNLYEASPETILTLIQELPKTLHSVMIVNHNPAISAIGNYLVGNKLPSFSTGMVACIDLEDWTKSQYHEGKLVFFKDFH